MNPVAHSPGRRLLADSFRKGRIDLIVRARGGADEHERRSNAAFGEGGPGVEQDIGILLAREEADEEHHRRAGRQAQLLLQLGSRVRRGRMETIEIDAIRNEHKAAAIEPVRIKTLGEARRHADESIGGAVRAPHQAALRANRGRIVVTERGQLDHDRLAEQPGERDDEDALLREAVQVDDVDVAGELEERRCHAFGGDQFGDTARRIHGDAPDLNAVDDRVPGQRRIRGGRQHDKVGAIAKGADQAAGIAGSRRSCRARRRR